MERDVSPWASLDEKYADWVKSGRGSDEQKRMQLARWRYGLYDESVW